MKHPFAVTFPHIRLCSSTLAEDLGRKLHVPHLQSQHLKMYLQVLKTRKWFELKRSSRLIINTLIR